MPRFKGLLDTCRVVGGDTRRNRPVGLVGQWLLIVVRVVHGGQGGAVWTISIPDQWRAEEGRIQQQEKQQGDGRQTRHGTESVIPSVRRKTPGSRMAFRSSGDHVLNAGCQRIPGIHGFPMALVRFTANLLRHVEATELTVPGATVAQVLEAVFHQRPRIRGYVLDDQGAVRKHMALFVDGDLIRDRDRLTDPVPPDGVIDIIQALSGG